MAIYMEHNMRRCRYPRPKTKKENMSEFWEKYFKLKKNDELEIKSFDDKDERWNRRRLSKLFR